MQACRGCLSSTESTLLTDVVMVPCALIHAFKANKTRDPAVPSDLAAPGCTQPDPVRPFCATASSCGAAAHVLSRRTLGQSLGEKGKAGDEVEDAALRRSSGVEAGREGL